MSSRRILIAANWKMNHGVNDTLKFFGQIRRQPLPDGDFELVICPPATSLYSASVAIADLEKFSLGAQNCSHEESGAFTGETSAAFLQELNCRYVIIGHSERRHIYHETDDVIARKLVKVFEHDLIPIFCVGETQAERDSDQTLAVITRQLEIGLSKVSKEDLAKLVIAYEPVWAIGTGLTATPAIAQEVHHAIRRWIGQNRGVGFASEMRILYGGSVKPDNTGDLISQPDIDGALVGGASLQAEGFIEIARTAASVVKR